MGLLFAIATAFICIHGNGIFTVEALGGISIAIGIQCLFKGQLGLMPLMVKTTVITLIVGTFLSPLAPAFITFFGTTFALPGIVPAFFATFCMYTTLYLTSKPGKTKNQLIVIGYESKNTLQKAKDALLRLMPITYIPATVKK